MSHAIPSERGKRQGAQGFVLEEGMIKGPQLEQNHIRN